MSINFSENLSPIDNNTEQITLYSEILAKHYGLVEEEILLIKEAVTLYDIGKLEQLNLILEKMDKFDAMVMQHNNLTDEENEFINTYISLEYKILKQFNKQFKLIASNITHERYERYDGNGYPMGLKKEEISIHGRIIALAIYIGILSKNQISLYDEEMFEMIKNGSGKQFDPKLVDIFFNNLEEFLK